MLVFENDPEEIRQIVKKAKDEEDNAKDATDIVNHAVDEMSPQRSHEDKSQNKR